jgi:pyrophosphatase PpaX
LNFFKGLGFFAARPVLQYRPGTRTGDPEIAVKLKAVIFDLDQTLVASQELIIAAFNHVLARYAKKELPPEQIVAAFGPTEEGMLQALLGTRYRAEALEDFYRYYQANHRRAAIYPGIKPVLTLLSSHRLGRGVFTGKGNRSTLTTLAAVKLLDSFEVIVTGDNVTQPKPNPEGLLKAMAALKSDTERTLMIGDASADFAAAREIGVRAWGAYWGVAEPQTYHQSLSVRPDRFFTTVADFHQALLKAISKR